MVDNSWGGRLCIPFIIWSLFYSGISLVKDFYHNTSVHLLGYIYQLVIGKSATPFYYIVVMMQLTIITPWLVKVVREDRKIKNFLWLVTPCYLVYLYIWNFITGSSPYLYETLFPAWFGFYYLGIEVKYELKLKFKGYVTMIGFLISCIEAFGLKKLGMSAGFYTSQITIGSFIFSIAVIGWLLECVDEKDKNVKFFSKIGDCSYGIFYIHMAVLMLVGKLIQGGNWFFYWALRFILTLMISYGIVRIGQKIFGNRKKILKYIGFI